MNAPLLRAVSEAENALGSLNVAAQLLPDADLLLSSLQRAEATASCQIEGAEFTWEEALLAAVRGDIPEDSELNDVEHLLAALEKGKQALPRRPFSMHYVKRLHEEIMRGPRGQHASPGSFRQIQVFVGARQRHASSASYVPPPQALIPDLMADWTRYVQENTDLPPLVQCAIQHAQFELIHPFRDGNGKTGRLLANLFLVHRGRLTRPVLFPQPLPRAPSARVLRSAARGQPPRRLGALDVLLPRRGHGALPGDARRRPRPRRLARRAARRAV